MKHYTTQPEQNSKIVDKDYGSAGDRYAQRISDRTGFPVAHVRTSLLANAAVKEQ